MQCGLAGCAAYSNQGICACSACQAGQELDAAGRCGTLSGFSRCTINHPLFGWGSNLFSILGDPTPGNRLTPARSAAGSGQGYLVVTAGEKHACGINAASGVTECFGAPPFGESLGCGTEQSGAVLCSTRR